MTLEALLQALEDAWIDPASAESEALTKLLLERQEILSRVQDSDSSTLNEGQRRRLAERVQGIIDRDEVLLAELLERQKAVRIQMERARQGRAAVRGYGATGAVGASAAYRTP